MQLCHAASLRGAPSRLHGSRLHGSRLHGVGSTVSHTRCCRSGHYGETVTTPQYPPGIGMVEFDPPRVRGRSAAAQRVNDRLPAAIVRHTFLLSWLWIAVWAAVALTEELTEIPVWVFSIATVLMVVPSLAATAICLWATPRYRLLQTESILSHFVVRFITIVFAFIAWTVSIVIGASISSVIQLVSENREKEVIGTGFELIVAVTPLVAILIWLGLILRCCWFLIRLRGWRALPVSTRLPPSFLDAAPRLRTWTTSMAHPGLVATAGLLSAIGTIVANHLSFGVTI